MSWLIRSKHKRQRKKIFELVTEIAQNCLSSFNTVSNEYPDVSQKRLYEMAILVVLNAANVHTSEDIEMILDISVRRHKHEDLSFLKVVHSVVNLHIPPEYTEIIRAPTKSAYIWGDEPKPSLEETFTTTQQIVESIIPSDM